MIARAAINKHFMPCPRIAGFVMCEKLCYRMLPAINSAHLLSCNATRTNYLR